jgi:hypothetical protein
LTRLLLKPTGFQLLSPSKLPISIFTSFNTAVLAAPSEAAAAIRLSLSLSNKETKPEITRTKRVVEKQRG